ncbi:uncharacterized protein LOC122146041 [Cyprinus carpio]|uniref:Uncharacterized protein LOC122146041 n=1 Tax=Cyprinus carpio TaxID=7962 RepID=A0A9R0B2B9_CYPCA|nr:uncharacterized protein LOC122146041 [Cyprinus carpio]
MRVTLIISHESEIQAVSLLLQKDDAAAGQKHNASGPQESECTLTYPSHLVYYLKKSSGSTYHDLNTRTKIPDPHGQMRADSTQHLLQNMMLQFIVDSVMSSDLLSSDYVGIHYENGKPVLWRGGEHCYYHGQIRGNDNSHASLSTCNGLLDGMFDDGVHVYTIEPLKQNHSIEGTARPHVLRRVTFLQQTTHAGEEDEKYGTDVISTLSDVQLGATTMVRRVLAMSRNLANQLDQDLAKCRWFSIQCDKSVDSSSTAQLMTTTRGVDIYNAVKEFFAEKRVPLEKLVSVTTNGAPAMIGQHTGFIAHCKGDPEFPNFMNYHCIIHQQALCAKVIGFGHVMTPVVRIINSIRSRAKQHRTFKTFDKVAEKYSQVINRLGQEFENSLDAGQVEIEIVTLQSGIHLKAYQAAPNFWCLVDTENCFIPMCLMSVGSTWMMAPLLAQSLAQNLGIQWDSASKRKGCGCIYSWLGCIMEDTGVQHPKTFSKCSITDFKEFLVKGGGSCLFNKPSKLFEDTEYGNGYVEVGEECDCGPREECIKECCKYCSLSNGAHCSDGPCCNNTSFYPRSYSCCYAVNDCDISDTSSRDLKGRCYTGECKTRDSQCKYVWGPKAASSEKFCYEKLNTDGSEKGNCGQDGDKWIQCSKHFPSAWECPGNASSLLPKMIIDVI